MALSNACSSTNEESACAAVVTIAFVDCGDVTEIAHTSAKGEVLVDVVTCDQIPIVASLSGSRISTRDQLRSNVQGIHRIAAPAFRYQRAAAVASGLRSCAGHALLEVR